jgi:predicted nucleic acid-binding Zn ribbon protein
MGGTQRGLEQRVFIAYTDAVGPELARRSRPDALKDATLFVRVESSAFAHELVLLRTRILERMNSTLGEELVTAFRTRVGPLDE